MKPALFCAALCLFAANAASAATFNYTGTVTSDEIDSGGGTSFGTFGDAVTATLGITAMPGEVIPVGLTSGGEIDISVASTNFTYDINFVPDGFNDGFNSSINVSDTGVFFATSSGTFTWPNEAGNTLRTVFDVDFGQTLGAVPTTFDDLIAAISLPTATANFRTNGNFLFSIAPGNVFDEYNADLALDVAAVPVPLSGLLLLSGLGALVLTRRRMV